MLDSTLSLSSKGRIMSPYKAFLCRDRVDYNRKKLYHNRELSSRVKAGHDRVGSV